MRATSKATMVMLAVAILASASVAQAGLTVRVGYHDEPADIRVWLESGHDRVYSGGYDVYRSVDDLVLCVRASHSTFATVYVVDADGFIHIVHPLSARVSSRLSGGHIYRIHLSDFHFARFGRGVSYAFAVASPRPFNYGHYGAEIFGCEYGYQIHGDPYVASRHFYFSLVGSCDPHLIRISHARFYIGEYVRYPRYLCVGWHDYSGARRYCSSNCAAFRYYRVHAGDPYRVLHPTHRIKGEVSEFGRVAHSVRQRTVRPVAERTAYKRSQLSKSRSFTSRVTRTVANGQVSSGPKRTNVVKSSDKSFAKSKTAAREMSAKRGATKSTRSDSRSKSKGSSGKAARGQR